MNTDDGVSFEIFTMKQKTSRYCVFVFAINEGDRLLNQLMKMKYLSEQIDIVVVDGGSSDGSISYENLSPLMINTLLINKGSRGLGVQIRIALLWALNMDYDGCILIDGNGKDGVGAIPSFMHKLDEGFDHIQGSRFVKGGEHKNTPLLRYFGVRFIHAPMMSLFTRVKHTDTTNGFRAYSSKLIDLNKQRIFRGSFSGYELHYYIDRIAHMLGFKCIEIPVSRCYPDSGEIPTKITKFSGNFGVLRELFKVGFGYYDV